MTNKAEQEALTRSMAEALRGIRENIDALTRVIFDEPTDFNSEFIGEEMDVIISVLMSRLGFPPCSIDDDNPIVALVYDYIRGDIEYEALIFEVEENHKLLARILAGDY